MARQRRPEDLSVEELRRLLIDKRRSDHQERLEHFRRTGRVIMVEDSAPAGQPAGASETLGRKRGTGQAIFDGLLLLVELAAVAGLIFVLWSGAKIMRNLNSEVATVLTQPTLTPTPVISAVVLPSGHTPPNAPGGVQPNDAEIPQHLRPLVQAMSALPVPTTSPEQAVRIQIPAIQVDAPIVQGDGWEQLKKGVAQHIGTPNPGQSGNMVLSAHNDVFGEIFRDLDRLKEGDTVLLYTNLRTYTYVVKQSQIVEPTQVELMGPSRDTIVTLISCYPYMVDDQRIVITAALSDQP